MLLSTFFHGLISAIYGLINRSLLINANRSLFVPGLSSGLVPMYLTEISPINLRGSLGSVAQLLITIGILFSQIIGLPQLLGTTTLWPMVFGALSAIGNYHFSSS